MHVRIPTRCSLARVGNTAAIVNTRNVINVAIMAELAVQTPTVLTLL